MNYEIRCSDPERLKQFATGRTIYGTHIAVRQRDQVWRAAVVTACLVAAAAIAIAVLVGGRG